MRLVVGLAAWLAGCAIGMALWAWVIVHARILWFAP